jgi:predicted NBD/HSP70 family sugar kinase
MHKGLPQKEIKISNLATIMEFVMDNPVTTRQIIKEKTGLSWGTVSTGVNGLIQKGYLISSVTNGKSGRGRIAGGVTVNDALIHTIGLDINRTGLSGVLVNLNKRKVATFSSSLEETSKEGVLKKIYSLLDKIMAFASKNNFLVVAIGLSVQGRVDGSSGISNYFPGCSDGEWKDVPLAMLVERRYGKKTILEHDPNCLLFGETRKRKNLRNVMLIRIDNGIGMAIMQDGIILSGGDRLEIGHVIVEPDGFPCVCGKKGCLESYASIRGLSRQANKPMDEIFAHAKEYAPLFEKMASTLAVSLYNAIVLFHPSDIIFAGQMMAHKDLFYDVMIEKMNHMAGEDLTKELAFSTLDEVNGAFGASLLAMKKALSALAD